MRLLTASPENIRLVAEKLREGGIVAFPTESVYGLGAIAWDAAAVARVFEAKRRPSFDPLIVHVLDRRMLAQVAAEVPPAAEALIERFWPGPLTIVVRKSAAIPGIVTAGLESVAVRMPSHPVARALLESAKAPIAAPSANPFGYLSPTRAEHVVRALGDAVDLVLDGGPATWGIESTIVAFDPQPALLRPGAIAAEEIEAVIGPLQRGPSPDLPAAPGQLPRHYSPRTPIRVARLAGVEAEERVRAGALAFREPAGGYAAVRVLSPGGDMREAAARLFDALHELDAMGLECIYAEPVEERGLGVAIADRLRRAQGMG